MLETAVGCPLMITVPPGTRTMRPSWSTMTEAGWATPRAVAAGPAAGTRAESTSGAVRAYDPPVVVFGAAGARSGGVGPARAARRLRGPPGFSHLPGEGATLRRKPAPPPPAMA